MIIGNTYAGPTFGRSDSLYKNRDGDSRTTNGPSQASNSAPPSTAASKTQPAYRFNSYGSQSAASSADSDSSLSMQQTARIVAQIAFRQQVDDVSAYALLGTPDQDTDQFRQVASSYGENTE